MIGVRLTETFTAWLNGLRDKAGVAQISASLTRLALGNPGSVAPVGEGVSEMRFLGKGPGYRVYYKMFGKVIAVVLGGGDKSTQAADIKRAIELAKDVKV